MMLVEEAVAVDAVSITSVRGFRYDIDDCRIGSAVIVTSTASIVLAGMAGAFAAGESVSEVEESASEVGENGIVVAIDPCPALVVSLRGP